MTKFPAMIFAAGFGTRMRPLSDHRPKPLVEVAGRPLVEYAHDLLTSAGVGPIIVNAHYHSAQIVDHFSDREIQVIVEETLLDTGGGLKNALPYFEERDVITLNSDAIWTGSNPVNALTRIWSPDKMDALLVLVPKEQAHGYEGAGDVHLDLEGRVQFREKDADHAPFVFTGLQVMNSEIAQNYSKKVFSLKDLWTVSSMNNRLYGYVHTGGWADVGRPDCIALAEALLQSHGH